LLLTHIRGRDLAGNALSGTLPTAWADAMDGVAAASGIQQLRQLDLSGNALSGTLPESWAAFSGLQHM
jgi:hypothetical protein